MRLTECLVNRGSGMKLDKDRLLDAIFSLRILIQGELLILDRASVRGGAVLGILGTTCLTCRAFDESGVGRTYLLRVTDDAGDLRVTLDEAFPAGLTALQVTRWGGVLGKTADFVTGE